MDTHTNVDKIHVESKKPDAKEYILYALVYMSRQKQFMSMEVRIAAISVGGVQEGTFWVLETVCILI